MKGIFHPTVGAELTQTEWESETGHNLANGTSFPASPEERDYFTEPTGMPGISIAGRIGIR